MLGRQGTHQQRPESPIVTGGSPESPIVTGGRPESSIVTGGHNSKDLNHLL